jgi:uncharacterized membrane protein (DUF373 family)
LVSWWHPLLWPAVDDAKKLAAPPFRQAVVQTLSLVEDIVYIGLGLLLTLAALTLLVGALKSGVMAVWHRSLGGQVVGLLDQILLILLIIELLYTVQVSFREHSLTAEPFIVVALIAVIRRILILTAEIPRLPEAVETTFRHAMLELGLLTAMVLVLVGSLIVLQKHAKHSV